MTKGICINNKPAPGCPGFAADLLKLLKEGEEYEGDIVKGIDNTGAQRDLFLIPSIHKTLGFDARRFMFLSDLDETELVNEKELALAH